MEHKRKASGPGAMKSRNSHWLEVSEVHYTSSPKLKADSLEAVSYTHLDVYKRQGLSLAFLPRFVLLRTPQQPLPASSQATG